MKKTVSMLLTIILLLGVLPAANFAQVAQAAAPGTYNPGDIAVVNRMIDNNELQFPKAPKDGSSVPDAWGNRVKWSNASTNKRIAELRLYEKNLTGSLNLSGLDALKELRCYNNKLTALDVSQNAGLKVLDFGWNQLTQIDVSSNTELTGLSCKNNQLTELDVSKNIKLKELEFDRNALTELDISKNTKLEHLSCSDSALAELDITKNTNLVYISCGGNKLTKLNTSKNSKLKYLYCGRNQLTKLDVSKNINLVELSCKSYYGGNQLTKLDVSKNTKLDTLRCQDNLLTKLDVSNNTKLTHLYCDNNQLTKLDVSKNTKLTDLYCAHNYMPSGNSIIGWKKIKSLKWFNYNPQQDSSVSGPSVKISPSSKKITVGETIMLTAKVAPTNITTVTWKSSNKSVAVMDYYGQVTAKAPGKATITVKTDYDRSNTATCVITVKPKKPTSVKVAVTSATSAEISWKKVEGASGYQVRRATSENGTYKTVKNTTGTSFTNTGLKAGKTYYYKVRAYKIVDSEKIYGAYSKIVSVKPKPLKVTGVKAVKAASGQAKISWKKQSGVSGYQIVRAMSKNGTYKSVGSTTKLTFTNKELTPGKTYYYKVRAYKTVSGKRIYGAYSNIMSVKV